jgi:hypothetical protein
MQEVPCRVLVSVSAGRRPFEVPVRYRVELCSGKRKQGTRAALQKLNLADLRFERVDNSRIRPGSVAIAVNHQFESGVTPNRRQLVPPGRRTVQRCFVCESLSQHIGHL